jgi:hypothetical protein
MIPHERELAEKLRDKPFTLLGINSDESRSALKKAMEEQRITWPQIYDGPPGQGPIAKRWNVHGWPTIFVLDDQGVIRHRDLRGDALEEAVMDLIAKMSTGRSGESKP